MPKPESTPALPWAHLARLALDEDCAFDDATTRLLGGRADAVVMGRIVAEGTFVVAGIPLVEAVFREIEPGTAFEAVRTDGDRVGAETTLVVIRAPARAILAGERAALNGLSHLSGVATATRRVVDAVAGTGAVVTDTRKTTPGLRVFEKYAVRVGGGVNHRFSLSDAVLWKDNHWALLDDVAALDAAVRAAPAGLEVCVEVETEAQLERALAAGVRWILVDNQPPETVAAWAARAGPDVVIEASGGITAENARAYAESGATRLSLGAVTYDPDPVSVRLDMESASD